MRKNQGIWIFSLVVIGISLSWGKNGIAQESSQLVCNPFSNHSDPSEADRLQGIVGNLKYLPDPKTLGRSSKKASSKFYWDPWEWGAWGQSCRDNPKDHYSSVWEYQKNGSQLDAIFVFGELNVPTQMFSSGFVTQAGTLLKDKLNNPVNQYFSLHLEAQLQLTSADEKGRYQLAVISDDGMVVQAKYKTRYRVVVNNDGSHSSRFISARRPLMFDSKDTRIPIIVDYFQGSRSPLSLILLWRPWPKLKQKRDPLEGKEGDSLFFDWNSPLVHPTQHYQLLLSRGWRPIPAGNFVLPTGIEKNPCRVENPIMTSIVGVIPPENPTTQNSMSFAFQSNYAGATFSCRLDTGSPTPCTSPVTYESLESGEHQFGVYSSANGLVDAVGAKYSWTIRPPLTTSISSVVPSDPITSNTSVSFSFVSNDGTATFDCRIDGGPTTLCTSAQAYSALVDGTHVFSVFASANGVTDPNGASYQWIVDTVAPRFISNSVSATSNSFTASWTTDEPATTQFRWGPGTDTSIGLPENTDLVTNHSVTIPNLKQVTVYSFIFGGKDQAGNSATSVTNRVRTSQ